MNPELLYILFLSLLFSAFFSGSEIAFVSSNKLLFELEKKQTGVITSILKFFYKHSNQVIITMLVGNGIALVIYSLLLIHLLDPVLTVLIPHRLLVSLIELVIATTLILILGEFIPKTVSGIIPNISLSFYALPLFIFYVLLYPASKLMIFVSWFIFRLFGVQITLDSKIKTLGRQDLDYFIQKTIEDSPEHTELDNEVRFFQNALDFSQVKLRDCIVPRTEIVALDINATPEDLLAKFIETGLSKILIYNEDIDNVAGYIHSSELFDKPKDWTAKIIPLPVVPENMAANKLMKSMLKNKKSMAVVIDEFGGTSGVITMEDLVEEIFGDIEDEHDTKLLVAKKIAEDEYVLSGRTEIDKVNEMFQLGIPESEDYVTVSGYILNQYRHFPKLNETIQIENFTFKIVKVTTTKIELIRVKVNK